MSIKSRINEFIEKQGIKRAVFEKSCGFSNGYTRNLKENPSASKIEDILTTYPEINRIWLLTGEGEMLNSESDSAKPARMAAIPANGNITAIKDFRERLNELKPVLLPEAGTAKTMDEFSQAIGKVEALVFDFKWLLYRTEPDSPFYDEARALPSRYPEVSFFYPFASREGGDPEAFIERFDGLMEKYLRYNS